MKRIPITLGALLAVACSDVGSTAMLVNRSGEDGGTSGEDGGNRRRNALLAAPSHGSPIALTADDTRLIVANKDTGTATIFEVKYEEGAAPALAKIAEIAVGAEPVQVALHPAGDQAYVLSRKDQRLVRIDDIGGTPHRGPDVAVGAEPTGLALTPGGSSAFVANFVDGTVTAIATATMSVTDTIDLNATLAASGLLGQGLSARPALAHPRAIAVTHNGDTVEDDETVWVTDFYAHQKVPLAADGSNADTAKTAVVYRIPVGSKQASIVELPPMKDMGFRDHKDGVAGCFPNQLHTMHVQGAFGYVLSVCASPKGPQGVFAGPPAAACTSDATCPGAVAGSCAAGKCATNCTADAQCGANGGMCVANVCAGNVANVRTTVAPAVSIIDLGGGKAVGTVNLAAEFQKMYAARGTPDDATRRLPLLPFDMSFVPGTVTAYFASAGTDAVFKVDFNATYEASSIDGVGDPKAPFINLVPAAVDPSRTGKVPMGIVIAHKKPLGFVLNEASRNVAVIDLATQSIAGLTEGRPAVAPSTAAPEGAEADRVEGKRLFVTGLGRWSHKGQGWASCESCHIDGFSDNVTWYFPRGPRQPQSLDGTFASKDPSDMRINNWTSFQDEVSDHEMGALRNNSNGLGAIVKDRSLTPDSRLPLDKMGHAGLAGSSGSVESAVDDWSKLIKHVQSIRSPRRPTSLDAALVARGGEVFAQAGCQGCHAGPKWTQSRVFYQPDPTGARNIALTTTSWSDAVTRAGFPTALLPTENAVKQTMRYSGVAVGDMDQLVCSLRNVGTFGAAEPEVGVAELRRDMATPAQGDEADGRGYNVPSLLGVTVGAPYLHAGQARTLEALLTSPAFSKHARALGGALDAPSTQALVQFLLSIDEDAPELPIPALGPGGGDFCAVQ